MVSHDGLSFEGFRLSKPSKAKQDNCCIEQTKLIIANKPDQGFKTFFWTIISFLLSIKVKMLDKPRILVIQLKILRDTLNCLGLKFFFIKQRTAASWS